MTRLVHLSTRDGVARLRIDAPPLNALSRDLRSDLSEALASLDGTGARAVILQGQGRSWPPGMDLSEIEGRPREPGLRALCAQIEDFHLPVVAALHGTALGAGFELALACHYRIARPGTLVGFPDITLGLVPSGGGTQRAPRLCGAGYALELMLSGRPVPVEEAARKGLIDAVIDEPAENAGHGFATQLLSRGRGPRRSGTATRGFRDPKAYQAEAAAARRTAATDRSGAAEKIIACVEAAQLLPLEAGLELEAEAFRTSMMSPQSRALRHAFRAEQRSPRFPELSKASTPKLTRIGLAGGGAFPAELAVAMLDAGLEVAIWDENDKRLSEAQAHVGRIYDTAIARGRLSEDVQGVALSRLRCGTGPEILEGAGLIIEAAPDLGQGAFEAKAAALARLAAAAPEGSVIAINSGNLDIAELARAAGLPPHLPGLHVLAPAQTSRLLEIVVPEGTPPAHVLSLLSLARLLRKRPVRSNNGRGRVGRRMLAALRTAAASLVTHGIAPYRVDRAMRNFGLAMPPLLGMDHEGLGRALDGLELVPRPSGFENDFTAMLDELGRSGRSAGAGFYLHPKDMGAGAEDPDMARLFMTYVQQVGIRSAQQSETGLQMLCLGAMANEGARLLDEGVIARPEDADVIMIHGYGFPRWRGGPMEAADLAGLFDLQLRLKKMAGAEDPFWSPHPLIADLIKNGRDFNSLNG